jgi:hydrogenase maturation factor HypF (carbamoyltransferase family)
MPRFSRFTLTGAIQGIGFRPYIYNACVQAGLSGFIQNTGEGVVIVIDNASAFRDILSNLPPHIRIDSIRTETVEEHYTGFTIHTSTGKDMLRHHQTFSATTVSRNLPIRRTGDMVIFFSPVLSADRASP